MKSDWDFGVIFENTELPWIYLQKLLSAIVQINAGRFGFRFTQQMILCYKNP